VRSSRGCKLPSRTRPSLYPSFSRSRLPPPPSRSCNANTLSCCRPNVFLFEFILLNGSLHTCRNTSNKISSRNRDVTSRVSQICFKSPYRSSGLLYRSSGLLYRFSSLHPTDSAATPGGEVEVYINGIVNCLVSRTSDSEGESTLT
jgi:hypothetical protein